MTYKMKGPSLYKGKLKDLRGTPTPKNGVNLSKMKGLGPRKAFGNVKNPELDPKRKEEDTAE
jgi:hypothetical protein